MTIIVGGSHGAGNYAMAGRAYDPDFLFMWPNAQISVMGGAQAADVLMTVSSKKTATDTERKGMRDKILSQFNSQSSAYYSTARLWDDGVIDPRDTRAVIARCLCVMSNKDSPSRTNDTYGPFRM